MQDFKTRIITTNNYFCEESLKDTYVLQLSLDFICYPNYQLEKEEIITYEN